MEASVRTSSDRKFTWKQVTWHWQCKESWDLRNRVAVWTYSEQGGKLQLSLQRHLQCSRRRQRQPALEGHANTVAAVLQDEGTRRWDLVLDNFKENDMSLTSCDRWDRSSAVTRRLAVRPGSEQWAPSACGQEKKILTLPPVCVSVFLPCSRLEALHTGCTVKWVMFTSWFPCSVTAHTSARSIRFCTGKEARFWICQHHGKKVWTIKHASKKSNFHRQILCGLIWSHAGHKGSSLRILFQIQIF